MERYARHCDNIGVNCSLRPQDEFGGHLERRLTAILAVDIVGYSRLMGMDEAGTLAAVRQHRAEVLDPRITQHKGRIVKHTGDGMLVEFSSVVNAVSCAAEIQRDMLTRNENTQEDRRIELRIGINLGDVIVEDGDIFGEGVNLAARLEGLNKEYGTTILVSDDVRQRVEHCFRFEHIASVIAKGMTTETQVYELVEATAMSCGPKIQPINA